MNKYIASNKIFHHPDRIKTYLNGGLVRPISVKLRLTDNCNLKCYYCSYKDNLNSGSMTEEDLGPIFDKLKELGVKSIVFTGGEPTCHDKFDDIVQLLKFDYNFDLALITNGVLPIKTLPYFEWVRFSLDTVDKYTYIRSKREDKLKDVMFNIQRAVEEKNTNNLKVTIGVQAIINKDNFDYQFKKIENVIQFAYTIGADYVQIRPLENYKYTEDEVVIIDGNIKALKEKDLGIKTIFTDYKWNEIKNGYKKDYEGCPSADFIGMVDVKGDLYMCCAMTNDPTAKYGNLITDKADTILEMRIKIQREFDYKKCTVACQGSLLNKTLADFKGLKHTNFI